LFWCLRRLLCKYVEKTSDGLILCHLINATVGHAVVNELSLNYKENMNIFQKTENLNKALAGARAIGCQIINIGAQDIIAGKPILILGIIWQIIKIQLLSNISLENDPMLVLLLAPGESLTIFKKLTAEAVLLRWLNFVLCKAGTIRRASDLGKDLAVRRIIPII
jgi:hypothetical protein